MIAAIVPAAGAGVRMEAERPKQFRSLGDRPLLVHTLQRLSASPLLDTVWSSSRPTGWPRHGPSLLSPTGLRRSGPWWPVALSGRIQWLRGLRRCRPR
ncbi:MAG: 2-C-methyl-D-erythritol 4-phosphate cytidylyltransferase, partial [Candidatus Tectimicrobiota bacterium]